MGRQIFGCFESTSDPEDCEKLKALFQLVKDGNVDIELQQLKIPLHVRGNPLLGSLFVTSQFVKEEKIREFLLRECERSEQWQPAKRADRGEQRRVQAMWKQATFLEEDEVDIRVCVLDLPQLLFGSDEQQKYFEAEHVFAVLRGEDNALLRSDHAMMVQLGATRALLCASSATTSKGWSCPLTAKKKKRRRKKWTMR